MADTNGIGSRLAASFKATFPALYSRNYQYFIAGQSISQIGTWMQSAAQSWLVYTTTNSAFKLSLVTAMQFLPVMFLSLFAGVFVDRFPKRSLVVLTQTVSALVAFALAILVFTGKFQYWHVLVTATISGLVRTVDNPARQSLMIELVGKDALVNAIGLNSSVFNVARIVGPAVAGFTYEAVGPAWCFLLNGISFIAVIAGLLLMKIQPRERKVVQKNVLREVVEGLSYISTRPLLLSTVSLAAIVNIFAVNHNVLLVVLARDVFQKGADSYGFMMSFMGAGSLVGALFMAVTGAKRGARSSVLGRTAFTIAGLLVALGAFSLFRSVPLALVALVLTGLFNITFSTNANSTMQLNAADGYRGRVMSVYFLMWGGTTPIGSMFAGALATRYGACWAYIVSGIVTATFIIGVLFLQRWVANRFARSGAAAFDEASDAE